MLNSGNTISCSDAENTVSKLSGILRLTQKKSDTK